MSAPVYTGSCLCGAVAYQFDGGLQDIIHCHCSRCRKASGSAYATNAFISAAGFNLLQGAETLRRYASSAGRQRYFCGNCGSPIYSSNEADPQRLRLRLGSLDCPISERPISHNFVSSKADWENLDAVLPRYDGHEPTRSQV